MPLLDDPNVTGSLLTPRGFIPLPGSDEEIRPAKPVEKPKEKEGPGFFESLAPTSADEAAALSAIGINPAAAIGSLIFSNPTGQAALRQSNTIASAIARWQDTRGVSNDLVDPLYSPWDDVVGTPYEKYWKNVFVHSNNPQYTAALKSSIDRQEDDRRTVEAGGAFGTIAGITAGVVDPTLLIPGGGAVALGGKGVWTITRGALAGARAGAVGTAAYEGGLQASQETRTAQESLVNIGTGVVLGAVLGGTIAGVLSPKQRVASSEALETIANMPMPGSVGAAAPRRMSLDDLTINGKITENIAARTAFSPNLRGNFREVPLARQTYQEIATNTLRQGMHEQGLSLGPSVETNINVSLGETLGQAMLKHPDLYATAKKAGFGMSSDAFDEAIGPAMRRNDVGENEFVTKAAQMWRKQVVEPLKNQAIELEMLPKDVKVTEAESYFTRMWNTEKMTAQKPVFVEKVTNFYNGVLRAEYSKSTGVLKARQADLLDELDILRAKPKVRAKKIAELKALKEDEKAQKILARLVDADEESIAARIAEIEAKQAELTRAFYDKWEIKRLGENIDLDDPANIPDFSVHARDMTQEVYDSITGNDWGSASVDPQFHLAAKSGPLKERTFHIPDELVEDFLENNVVKVMSRFARTMASQIEMARKFPGDPLLTKRFQQIKEQYDVAMNAATTEAQRTKLNKDMHSTFRDLRALLEIHRGSYRAKENASSWGRAVRGTMHFNYIRSMGGAAIPSLADLYNPAIFHGFANVMEVGVPGLMKALKKQGGVIKEAQYAGVAERLAHHRLMTMAEIGDPYAPGTAIERFMESATHVASKWNGLNMLTDFEKAFDSIVVQNRMNKALLSANTSAKDTTWLANSGLTPDMRTRIAEHLRKHGTEEDGITVANTDQWDDFDAVRAYRSVINFNINADVVTRGIGDVPLMAYSPSGKLLLQFKTFAMAAHQRTMLRATQLGPAQFLSGLIGLTTIGMFTTYLKALRGGKENFQRFENSVKNKGYWIGEGLDATGFFTLPIELSNITEKATSAGGYPINPIKTPLMLAGRAFTPDASMQANSQRYAGKGVLSAVAGPTGGLLESAAGATGVPIELALEGEVARSKVNAANQLVPYQSYIGMREMIQIMEGNSPYLETDNPLIKDKNE